jgi:hypothetical protein
MRLTSLRANVTIDHDHDYFAVDNVNQGFSLYSLEDMRFLHEYPTGQPTRRFPKQIEFGEGGRVLVGGSDHGTIYVFDRKTGLVMDTLHHEDKGLSQAVTVSPLCQQINISANLPN